MLLPTAIACAEEDAERDVARGTAEPDAISAKTCAHEPL